MALTREEIMNGWTEETLAAYLKERGAQKAIFEAQPTKQQNVPNETTSKFNPHNW